MQARYIPREVAIAIPSPDNKVEIIMSKSTTAGFPIANFLVGFLSIFCLGSTALGFGPATTCEELPANFAQIKANLESHQKAMTDAEVERTLTDLASYSGRSFRRQYAHLASRLTYDISDWHETANKCSSINPDWLYKEVRACDAVADRVDAEWKPKVSAAQDKQRMLEANWAIRGREYAKCFVSFESKLFAPHRVYAKVAFPTTKVTIPDFPFPVTVPAGFSDVTKEVFGDFAVGKGQMLCEPGDATLARDQLMGNRIDEHPSKGCITIAIDETVKLDTNIGKFSTEDDVLMLGNSSSKAKPQIRILESLRRGFNGRPTHSYSFEVRDRDVKVTWNYLYIFDSGKVWSTSYMYSSQCQENLCRSIWDALVDEMRR